MTANSEIRRKARETLGGRLFCDDWIFPMIVILIASVVIGFTSSFVIGILAIGIVYIGLNKYYLCRSRKSIRSDNFSVLIDGVKHDIGGNIVLGILIPLFTCLWSLLFIIPGIVKSYSYSMAYFIKVDHPEYTATQAITESRRIMDGNKMKLFLLDLSFIGWMIVGTFCLGVGVLWANAYLQAAHTEFYRDIIGDTGFVDAE